MAEAETLESVLNRLTKEGGLYEKLPEGRVRCFACGHRCVIPAGRAGVCRVRFNQDGILLVPSGYVGALQDDPIEKKPFFHAMPGARVLSFGMLGCDYHCGYCFTPSTRIATSRGPLPIGELVAKRFPVEVYTHTGLRKKIQRFFERPYKGPMFRIKPAFLPQVECTPEHPFLVRLRPDRFPTDRPIYLEAKHLTKDHCLVLPKHFEFSEDVVLEAEDYLRGLVSSYRVKRKVPREMIERIIELTKGGKSSRDIGNAIGKSASHVRHIRSKIARHLWDLDRLNSVRGRLVHEDAKIRFSKEHAPGIPRRVPLTPEFAELLGYYCAEGSVSRSKRRVHAATLNFAFGRGEQDKAERAKLLLERLFGVKPYLVQRETTLAVAVNKSSLAAFFKVLCGDRGFRKRVPEPLFQARREVVEKFLEAYVAGDGYRAPGGQIRVSTISEELSWGVAWLVQKLGFLPQCYKYPVPRERKLLGRKVTQFPWIYLVRWYENPVKQRHVWEDAEFRYVLTEKIERFDYDGFVYNLEIEGDHTYLANFVVAHNCQNWVTSQALRDPVAGAPPALVDPEGFAELALNRDCDALASTYNEPLITSEWAVEIFKAGRAKGLVTAYISNGNGTPEVLDYIRPWVDLYKVDLKGFDDRHYRELGGTLENVCQTIRNLYERKFWLEVLTLLIPGFNNDDGEIKRLTEFLASVSPDIPWHVTAFHKDYKMTDPENTRPDHLLRACEIGKQAGLRYIYAGNLPGMVEDWENTWCPNCRSLLIERYGFQILENRLTETGGHCPKCRTLIPGFWKKPRTRRPSENRVQPLL